MKLAYLIILLFSVNLQAVSKKNDKEKENQIQVNQWIERGENLLSSSPDSALFYAEKSEQIAQTIQYNEGVGASRLLKGKALNAKKTYSAALVVLKSAVPFISPENELNTGQNYYEQGVAFYRTGQADSAINYLSLASKILKTQPNKIHNAHAERMLALAHWSKGMYADGLLHIQNAIDLYEELNDVYYLSTAYNTKGAILWGLASYEKALELFFEALYLNERTGQNLAQNIVLLNNIGLVYHDWEDDENALKYFKRAEELIPESENQVGIAYTYLNLGTLYLRNNDVQKALELLNKSLDGYAAVNDINGVCLSKIRIGQCHTKKGEFQLAEASFRDAINDSRKSGNKHREATAYFHLSKNDIARNALPNALENSLICLEISENGQYKDIIHDLYQQLSAIYEKRGETDRSLKMLQKAMNVKDEIYREKIAVQYNIMDLTYENKLQEIENSRLKTENLLKQRSLYFMYGMVLFILAGLIAVSFFYLKLKKRKKELQQANQAKDKIFSIVAHDLRSPVGTLNSMVDILTEEDHELDYREILNKFKPIIAGSFDMLENLLVWAKSNLGKLDTNPVPLSLNKIIAENISLFSHFSQEKSITVKHETSREIEVMADKILLETVIRNLLKNAIKFTPEKGKITIKSSTDNLFAIISVVDNGMGIPKEVQPAVFNGFYHSAGTQNEKGTGLGLMLSKELAEKNGGKLWFTSTEGKGSTFSFSVPLASAK